MEKNKRKQKNASLDVYRGAKQWVKSSLKKSLDPEQVDHYIYNDLPLGELYDDMKLYDYSWKDTKKRYNLNKKKKEQENGNDKNM